MRVKGLTGETIKGYIAEALLVLMEEKPYGKIAIGESARRQFEISYHIGGIYNNMILWMDHGMRETPDQMTEIALSFKPEGSLTLLNV